MQKGYREKSFSDRLSEAAKAKQAQLDRARAKLPANDPGFAARQEERRLAQLARAARQEERRHAKLATQEREAAERRAAEVAYAAGLKAEAQAREAELKAEAEAREAEAQTREADRVEGARREKKREADQKTARDVRYAARKARQK